MPTSLPPRDLPDHFLSIGRSAFTVEEAVAALESSRSVALDALRRLQARSEVFSPAKGLYVAVPPEYRNWGVVPGDWFIDALMKHLRRPYYVALLSAARHHGASHQAPQIFQVMTTTTAIRDRDLKRVRIRFFTSKYVTLDKSIEMTVPTGYVTVSAKETTVVDLIGHYRVAGGYGNVATIVREIGTLSGAELARVASRRGRAAARRTGWFVSKFGEVDDLEALRQAARLDIGEPTPLLPTNQRRGKTDSEWAVRVNVEIEPDL